MRNNINFCKSKFTPNYIFTDTEKHSTGCDVTIQIELNLLPCSHKDVRPHHYDNALDT